MVISTKFLDYVDNIIVKGKNWSKKMTIDKFMTFSDKDLSEPLTNCDLKKEADQIYRSILKLAGNRRSRFPENYHIENIIAICLGQQSRLTSDDFHSIYLSAKIEKQYKSKTDKSNQEY